MNITVFMLVWFILWEEDISSNYWEEETSIRYYRTGIRISICATVRALVALVKFGF